MANNEGNASNKEPEANVNDNYLNLKVKSQDGEEVFFKIKKSTQFKKLMDAYCNRQQINPQNVRFLFDGERITEQQSPNELNMENNDEIDVVVEQTGGLRQLFMFSNEILCSVS